MAAARRRVVPSSEVVPEISVPERGFRRLQGGFSGVRRPSRHERQDSCSRPEPHAGRERHRGSELGPRRPECRPGPARRTGLPRRPRRERRRPDGAGRAGPRPCRRPGGTGRRDPRQART
ncbi:hypothetical protein C6C15_16550 [Microbacterium sp. str. 'China']|nr:hypothetical protein C6C15_16550 [Microbacterium sp. str. 'China']